MSKKTMISRLAHSARLTTKQAAEALDALQWELVIQMHETGSATLPGVGSFKLTTRAARAGRNPISGAKIQIPEKKHIKFVAAKSFKEGV
jgi:DNA-binding protein HU-beta